MIIRSLSHFYQKESEHFKAYELYDKGRFAPERLLMFKPMLDFAEALRIQWGRPLSINAGMRTQEKQDWLGQQGYRTAQYSPHVYRCALDFDTARVSETRQLVEAAREVSKTTAIPIRIGWETYLNDGMTFVHIDTAPILIDAAFCEGEIPEWVHSSWRQAGVEW